MKPSDIGQAIKLERICFSMPWSESMFISELNNPACSYFAAFNNGELIGYSGMLAVLDEGYISNIAVHPEHRRQGAGSALMNALIEKAAGKELAFLTLEVRESNTAAILLYEKFGFVRVGKRRGYYERPKEDAVLMTLNLNHGRTGEANDNPVR